MANSPDKEVFLTCGSCGHNNEPERVYCHSCGQKLDRTLLPPPEAAKSFEKPEDQRKRVQKMMSVRGPGVRKHIVTGIQVLLFAAIVAALFLLFQKPEGTPDAKADSFPDRNVGDLWAQMMETKPAITITFTEAEINYWLGKQIKPAGGSIPGVTFSRAFVRLAPGSLTFTAQRDAWGLPTYSSMSYTPKITDNAATLEVTGVHFGKLGIHPVLSSVGEFSLDGITKALDREIRQAGRLSDIQIGEGTITFITKQLQ